jgi:alpha-1,3-rhamnosyl/mannosyltransferase
VYAGAVGLVYPSHYEGFGLPPMEMLASGGAVLASTADAIREVCGDHAAFLEPEDIPAWRTALLRLATDAEYREQLRRGGVEHAARFTWERAAAETVAVYRSVLGLAPMAPLASRSAA